MNRDPSAPPRNGAMREAGEYVLVDPRLHGGKPLFKGTRLSIQTVLYRLARGATFTEILTRWPQLTREAVGAAVNLAAAALLEKHAAVIAAARASAKSHLPPEQKLPPVPVGKHVVVWSRMCFGKMTFAGTRLPVATMLAYVAAGRSLADLHEGWPYLKPQALAEGIRLAARALVEKYRGCRSGG